MGRISLAATTNEFVGNSIVNASGTLKDPAKVSMEVPEVTYSAMDCWTVYAVPRTARTAVANALPMVRKRAWLGWAVEVYPHANKQPCQHAVRPRIIRRPLTVQEETAVGVPVDEQLDTPACGEGACESEETFDLGGASRGGTFVGFRASAGRGTLGLAPLHEPVAVQVDAEASAAARSWATVLAPEPGVLLGECEA